MDQKSARQHKMLKKTTTTTTITTFFTKVCVVCTFAELYFGERFFRIPRDFFFSRHHLADGFP